MPAPRRFLLPRRVLLAALLGAAPAAAQEHGHAEEPSWGVGAQAIPLVTHAAPAVFGESRTEAYLTQPMLTGHAALLDGRLRLDGVLNFEGLTLRRGELNAGIWGEGYVDRRHPHTFVHEVMVSYVLHRGARAGASVSAGKGFAPFGTDDPMVRPFVKYPINHHLAQVLERALVGGAARMGPLGVEAAVFNGDEPLGPTGFATLGRVGDSWAARLSLWPAAGLELQGSYAWLKSPEMRSGAGADHRKWSASARWETRAADGARRYALVEWARTTDYGDGQRGSHYGTVLAEGLAGWRGTEAALRYERTERPEEERLLDPFRTVRPHVGSHALGLTRWDALTLNLARDLPLPGAPVIVRPFVEGAVLHAREMVRPSFFEPELFYGNDTLWSLSAGLRIGAGRLHPRMGRYGAAVAPSPTPRLHH